MCFKDIQICYRTQRKILFYHEKALVNARLEVRDFLPDMINAPFSTFALSTIREDLTFLSIELQKESILIALRNEEYSSISAINAG